MNTYQDKFGKFHSVDRETYNKLRKVRFFRHVEWIQLSRWQRWIRKLPKNRVLWKAHVEISSNHPHIYTEWKAEPWLEPEPCPINLNALEAAYEKAKVGHDTADDVAPMLLPLETVDTMIKMLYEWSDRCYGHRN